jgi:hypothetical protein
MKRFKIAVVLVLCAFVQNQARAQLVRERPFFSASRALAMGDAYVAYAAGFEAVYYNPAGVAKRHAPHLKYLDLELTGSQTMYTYFQDAISSLGRLGNIVNSVVAHPDKPFALGLSVLPQFIVRNFSVGILSRSYTEAYLDSTTTDLDLYAYSDLGLYLQYGVAFFGGVIKAGVGLKAIDRAELQKTYTAAEYATGSLTFGSQWQEGIGYGLDAGLLVTLPWGLLPAFALVVQDVGNTTLLDRRLIFTGSKGRPGAPPALQQRVNAGAGIEVKHSPGLKSSFQIEAKNILEISSANYLDHLHTGWELQINKVLSLRAGLNQGRYWTAGFGISLGGVGLEFSTYGENVLMGTGQRRDDRKYVGRYVLFF